jgi:predicted GNAT family N-acyltransferase
MNTASAVSVRRADWESDAAALESVRQEVFVEEQNVPKDLEWDGRDADALHVIAEVNGTAVGCGRLLGSGRIGRLAVRRDYRGQGIGAQMLETLIGLARERGDRSVYLHAQAPARRFYEAAGFEARGEPFEEAGIEHVDMLHVIDYRDYDKALSKVSYPSPIDQLVVALARSARRDLAILSPDLDPLVFESPELLDAARLLIRSERQARVRILVADAREVVRQGRGLLNLARRAPSKVMFRSLREHPDWSGDTLVVRDRDGVLGYSGDGRVPGYFRPDDRASCETALGRFDDLWKSGIEHPEFRNLSI